MELSNIQQQGSLIHKSTALENSLTITAEADVKRVEEQLLAEQQLISELVHYVSVTVPATSDSDKETKEKQHQQLAPRIQHLKDLISSTENEIHRKEQELAGGFVSHSSTSSSLVALPTPDQVSEALFAQLPLALVTAHEALSRSLFLSDFQHGLVETQMLRRTLEPEIARMTEAIAQHFDTLMNENIFAKEAEVRSKKIREEHEEHERVALVQLWHKECARLLDAAKNRSTNINSRGSELQHTLGSKREELQRANQELILAEESFKNDYGDSTTTTTTTSTTSTRVNSSQQHDDNDHRQRQQQRQQQQQQQQGEDDTSQLLHELQNQFTDLQAELHLRPTHAESGLERLREQIVALSQELAKSRSLLLEAMSKDAGDDEDEEGDQQQPLQSANKSTTRFRGVLSMKNELEQISKLQNMKQELIERIASIRERIEQDQHALSAMNIEVRRKEMQEKQRELSREVGELRDRLLSDGQDD